MKIALSAGHNVHYKYYDCGSIGSGLRECDITRETVRILKELLEKQGHNVIDVTPYDLRFKNSKEAHQYRANLVNKFHPDIYLDVHVNAGGGTGSEVLLNANNKYAYDLGNKITKQISSDLGIRNRGVKHQPSFFTISQTTAPSIIIEGGFIESDMDKLTAINYANSIARIFGKVEGEYTIKQLDIKVDGITKNLKSINVDGHNYVSLKEIGEILGYIVSNKGSLPIISPSMETIEYDGEKSRIESIKLNGNTNFFKVKTLDDLGIIKATWNNKDKTVELG